MRPHADIHTAYVCTVQLNVNLTVIDVIVTLHLLPHTCFPQQLHDSYYAIMYFTLFCKKGNFLYGFSLLLFYFIGVSSGLSQVLIATSTLAWGVNFPAHLVVVKGTEYYDGKSRRYVDYPITGTQFCPLVFSHFNTLAE